MVGAESDGEAEDHVGGGVGVVVQPQQGGGDGSLVDVPLQAGDGEGAIQTAVEAEFVPRRGRGGRPWEDVRTRGDGYKWSQLVEVSPVISLTYYGEDLCSSHGVEVRELVANFTPVNSPTGQRHRVQLDSGGAAAQFLTIEKCQSRPVLVSILHLR